MCYPLSFRQVEGILHEPEIDICPETVWFWVDEYRWMDIGAEAAGWILVDTGGMGSYG